MADHFIIKQHDTLPKWRVPILQNIGTPDEGPVDLSAAVTLRFMMRSQTDDSVLAVDNDTNLALTDAEDDNEVEYTWQEGDTDIVGLFDVEVEATWGDGSTQTFPNYYFWVVEVKDDLDVP